MKKIIICWLIIFMDRRTYKGTHSCLFSVQLELCFKCGSLGLGDEGAMVFCTHCGEGYHPYCIDSFTMTDAIATYGWR